MVFGQILLCLAVQTIHHSRSNEYGVETIPDLLASNDYQPEEHILDGIEFPSLSPSDKDREEHIATNRSTQADIEEEPRNLIPYMVSLEMSMGQSRCGSGIWMTVCRGSIIGHNRVLTAAHCFDDLDYLDLIISRSLIVVAGGCWDPKNLPEESTTKTTQWRHVIDVVIHNDYDLISHDIALVMVEWSFHLNREVFYVEIGRHTMDYPNNCKAFGFRCRNNLDYLMSHVVPMNMKDCSRFWGMNMRHFVCSISLVTQLSAGDSGGPLVCSGTLDDAETPGQDLLVGIITGKNKDKFTLLFTRVSEYVDWIDGNSSRTAAINNVLILIILFIFIYVLFLFTLDDNY